MSRYFSVVSAIVLSFALSGCVATGGGSGTSLQTRVERHDQQLQQLMSQVGQVEQVRPGQAEMWSQLQTIRQEINILNGKIDDLQGTGSGGEIGRLREKVARLESVVRQMASQLAINVDSLDMSDAGYGSSPYSAGQPTSPSSASGYQSSYQTEPQYPISPGLSSQPGGTTGAVSGATGQPGPLVLSSAGATQGASTPASGGKDTATTLYDIGIKAFDERRYQEAVVAFKDFTSSFPKHNLASQAHFWEGESYFALKDYARAALAYQEIISNFPGSSKMQSAMLKQGISLYNANKKAAGKERLQELVKRYPNSPESTRAKQFLASNK